jgi:uncharacterized protein (DUF2384 family)
MSSVLTKKAAGAASQHGVSGVMFVVVPVARKTMASDAVNRTVARFKARNPETKILGVQRSGGWRPIAQRLTVGAHGIPRLSSGHSGAARRRSPVQPAQASALAGSRLLDETTRFLRNANGMLDAAKVADLFTLKPAELAPLLGVSKQAFSTTTTSPNYQAKLETLERIARLLAAIDGSQERFKQWVRTPNRTYGNRSPLQLIRDGQAQFVADHIEGYMSGLTT